jgi:hypothetical protein
MMVTGPTDGEIVEALQADRGRISVGTYVILEAPRAAIAEFREAARLPWRDNVLAPHEPRMPAHQYVVVQSAVLDDCRILELMIDHHPDTSSAYFRGYQHPTRYLEVGRLRYWRSRLNGRWFVNRCRLDSCEPPRRVDQGARPIPPEEWGAKYPCWPQGSGYGEWKRERGELVFCPEDAPPT